MEQDHPHAKSSIPERADPTRRRAMLAVGAAAIAGWVYGAPRIGSLWPSRLTFRDLEDLEPFRELAGAGALSSGNGVLVGLERTQTSDGDQAERIAAVRADPCTALFGRTDDPRIPVAFFSDINCPNCRVLEAIFSDYEKANPGVLRIIRFELPLLGPASTTAARAVIAAERQGAYAAMQDRLMRSRMVTDLNLVQALAEETGLDGARLVADMRLPEIDVALDQARAIASVFGFYGTPGTVIGHTAFLGAISAADVSRIIDAEQDLPRLPCREI